MCVMATSASAATTLAVRECVCRVATTVTVGHLSHGNLRAST